MSRSWKEDIQAAIAAGEKDRILDLARPKVSQVIRYLMGRLYLPDDDQKQQVIRALGVIAADRYVVDEQRAMDLLRRFVWALNDESGAVPYGVPEAIGEVLAVRPEFQEAFLPILCALLTEDEMSQTGPIERGALWAVGRVGPPVAAYSQRVVTAVEQAAKTHPDAETRAVAADSLGAILRASQ